MKQVKQPKVYCGYNTKTLKQDPSCFPIRHLIAKFVSAPRQTVPNKLLTVDAINSRQMQTLPAS